VFTSYVPASNGRALVAGYDVFDQPIEDKRRTGYLPETPPLYPDMTVHEYLDFVARIKRVPPAERKERVTTAMKGSPRAHRRSRPTALMTRARIDTLWRRAGRKAEKAPRRRAGPAPAAPPTPD